MTSGHNIFSSFLLISFRLFRDIQNSRYGLYISFCILTSSKFLFLLSHSLFIFMSFPDIMTWCHNIWPYCCLFSCPDFFYSSHSFILSLFAYTFIWITPIPEKAAKILWLHVIISLPQLFIMTRCHNIHFPTFPCSAILIPVAFYYTGSISEDTHDQHSSTDYKSILSFNDPDSNNPIERSWVSSEHPFSTQINSREFWFL